MICRETPRKVSHVPLGLGDPSSRDTLLLAFGNLYLPGRNSEALEQPRGIGFGMVLFSVVQYEEYLHWKTTGHTMLV